MLLFFLGLSFLTAFIGTRFPVDEWYASLNKPTWNPPNYLFGLVWTPLYILIAISGWLIWKETNVHEAGFDLAKWAFLVFALQLILNAAWSWLFFGEHRMSLALAEILCLAFVIAINIKLFYDIKPIAGLLLVPYLCWVCFASFLNYTLLKLNPTG